MSHITKVKTQLKDGMVLRESLARIGYRVHEAGSRYNGPSNPFNNAEFVADKDGEHLGFQKISGKVFYEILADWQIIKRNRKDIVDQITQTYSQEKMIRMARTKGFSVITNRLNTKGQIEMLLRKVA